MTQESTAPLASSVRAEAAAWVARLHSSERSKVLEAGLHKWLKADPAHARAFEVATEAWELGASIPAGSIPRMSHSFEAARAPLRKPSFAIAASLLVALAGALFYLLRASPLATTTGEQRMLTLEDGSRIFLNTDTRLFVDQDASQRRVRLESGEALFDVAKDPHRPFIVTAGARQVTALGTSFVVRRDERRLAVTLMEGKVTVAPIDSAASAPATVLAPGQRLTFTRSSPPVLDQPTMDSVTAWRRGEVILDKTRLQDAIDEMNRYSAVKLVIDDARVADIRVSGIFRAGDSERFAQAVAATYQLNIDHAARRIVLSDAPD